MQVVRCHAVDADNQACADADHYLSNWGHAEVSIVLQTEGMQHRQSPSWALARPEL